MLMRHAVVGLAALIGLTASAALAHHGWSSYSDAPFTLTGTVEMVELGSPHGHLAVRAAEGVWEVTLGPPYRNRRAGIDGSCIAAREDNFIEFCRRVTSESAVA